jgi:uncharacterized membrane protein YccC
MTPYVLILFQVFGIGYHKRFQERVIDTLIGSGIAFIASYVLFPTWEFQQIQLILKSVITARYQLSAKDLGKYFRQGCGYNGL